MNVTLDCIVFGLQRFGGISAYWDQLAVFMSRQPDVALRLDLPRTLRHQSDPPVESLNATISRSRVPTRLARYTLAHGAGQSGIFHSSYFRMPLNGRARRVVTVYDFAYEKFRRGIPRAVHSAQKFSAIRQADGVICISESTRNDLFEMVKGIDPAKVVVIPLAVTHERFFASSSADADVGFGDMVLFVGQRGGYKQFMLAVNAVSRIPQLRIAIVGPALSQQETGELERRLPGRWLMLGGVSDERLRVLYTSCFAFIFPSSYEGFGLPVLEAMACGAPVVTSNISSLPEVAGDAALKASAQTEDAYAERLSMLLPDGARARWVERGFARAAEFSWQNTFEKTYAFYQALVNGGAGNR